MAMEKQTTTTMTSVEDRDALKQQNLNLRMVFKEMSEQLSVFKNRCAGVDTVTLLLRESRSENIRLTRQMKVMETALANLQNRLSNNGLSNSVNIEETEMFVPGASKQTIDNLARENARLKSQLKHSDISTVKKQTKELEHMKQKFEKLEADHRLLNDQLIELNHKEQNLIQKQNTVQDSVTSSSSSSKTITSDQLSKSLNISLISTGIQTEEALNTNSKHISKEKASEGLKRLLANVSIQCQTWERELQETYLEVKEGNNENNQKFVELKRGYDEVVLMNHRWQKHCEGKDMETHALHTRIVELEDVLRLERERGDAEALQKELSALTVLTTKQGAENDQLKQHVACLQEELLTCRATMPKVDMSMLEILKQQIQVCTEDFNTERKDREEAVRKAKAYQEEVNRLATENNLLRTQLDKLSKEISALQQKKLTPRDHHSSGSRIEPNPPQTVHHIAGLQPAIRAPVSLSNDSESSLPKTLQPFNTVLSPSETAHPSTYARSTISPTPAPHDFSSLPRQTQPIQGFEGLPTLSYLETEPGMASMPAPKLRAVIPQHRKHSRGQYQTPSERGSMMACPKCNREFSDNETNEFMVHLESCTH